MLNTKIVAHNYLIFMMFVLCFLVSMVSAFSVNANEVFDKDLNLSIKVIEPEITKQQPIKIKLCFESRNNFFRIYRHHTFGIAAAIGSDDWLHFEIIAPNGIAIKDFESKLPNPKRPWKGDYIEVGPKSSYSEVISIFSGITKGVSSWPESGEYRLRAIYSYKQKSDWEYGRDLWEGTIESNWVTIKVK